MILKVLIIFSCLLCASAHKTRTRTSKCLTGYMTDVQSWVDEHGSLLLQTDEKQYSIDLSGSTNSITVLNREMTAVRSPHQYVKYLSMARCRLTRTPPVFLLQDNYRRPLASTLEYLTLYGNSFFVSSTAGDHYAVNFNATGAVEANTRLGSNGVGIWSTSITSVTFLRLKELDLRACSIQILGPNLFTNMPNLTALYLGENEIYFIDPTAFLKASNLQHLDLSWNQPTDEYGVPRTLVSDNAFKYLQNLVSLDLSFARLTPRNLGIIRSLGKSLRSVSLCDTGLSYLADSIFRNTSVQILDVSRNNGILNDPKALEGLERNLTVLFAQEVGLNSMNMFFNFTSLRILQLSNNEINRLPVATLKSMVNLTILDLNKNRVNSWFERTYSWLPQLQYLSLKDNNINIIAEEMIEDLMNVSYIALSGNTMICSCHAKDLLKMAAKNEMENKNSLIKTPKEQQYHSGYEYYNSIIENRLTAKVNCDEICFEDVKKSGRFRLVDYSPESYICLSVHDSKTVRVPDIYSCGRLARDGEYEKNLEGGRKKLLLLLTIPCVLLPVALMFVFRRRLRYFMITIRNSAMLSLIDKKDVIDDNTIFNYDVFVSYCNEDRAWVLDHLLPHIETECSISACLHERDFLLGLSILENIVSCMDRSRSILLIISQQFLLSQWCQFEMHLAQHRLLETRREDLTLVLLEDIPRRLRPNILHYLMLTKTYIVWPKDQSERPMFWRRLKKTLISQKMKPIENVSIA